MNADIHLEHRAGSSQDKHEGESSFALCDRLDRTRDNSQRQLPTDHDYAVPTREYQTDQSSLKTAPTAARSVFGRTKKQQQRPKQPHRSAVLTRSLHIRPMHLSKCSTENPVISMSARNHMLDVIGQRLLKNVLPENTVRVIRCLATHPKQNPPSFW